MPDGKIVLITGASRGIGEQLAYEFASHKARLAITYARSAEQASSVADECLRLGSPDVLSVQLDLNLDESIKKCAAEVLAHYGEVDILINNAGVLLPGNLSKQSFNEIGSQIQASLTGPLKFTSVLLPHIRQIIANVGSNLAFLGKKNLAAYSAAKFGIRGFTKALAREWPNLKILALHPGLTATGMGNEGGADPAAVARVIFEFAAGLRKAKSGADIFIHDYLPGFWKKPSRLTRRIKAIWA